MDDEELSGSEESPEYTLGPEESLSAVSSIPITAVSFKEPSSPSNEPEDRIDGVLSVSPFAGSAIAETPARSAKQSDPSSAALDIDNSVVMPPAGTDPCSDSVTSMIGPSAEDERPYGQTNALSGNVAPVADASSSEKAHEIKDNASEGPFSEGLGDESPKNDSGDMISAPALAENKISPNESNDTNAQSVGEEKTNAPTVEMTPLDEQHSHQPGNTSMSSGQTSSDDCPRPQVEGSESPASHPRGGTSSAMPAEDQMELSSAVLDQSSLQATGTQNDDPRDIQPHTPEVETTPSRHHGQSTTSEGMLNSTNSQESTPGGLPVIAPPVSSVQPQTGSSTPKADSSDPRAAANVSPVTESSPNELQAPSAPSQSSLPDKDPPKLQHVQDQLSEGIQDLKELAATVGNGTASTTPGRKSQDIDDPKQSTNTLGPLVDPERSANTPAGSEESKNAPVEPSSEESLNTKRSTDCLASQVDKNTLPMTSVESEKLSGISLDESITRLDSRKSPNVSKPQTGTGNPSNFPIKIEESSNPQMDPQKLPLAPLKPETSPMTSCVSEERRASPVSAGEPPEAKVSLVEPSSPAHAESGSTNSPADGPSPDAPAAPQESSSAPSGSVCPSTDVQEAANVPPEAHLSTHTAPTQAQMLFMYKSSGNVRHLYRKD